MFASRERELVLADEEIARCCQIAARVCSAVGNLRCAIQGCSATNNHRADGLILINPARQVHGSPAIEIECSARKAEGSAIDHAGGKNMRLAQTRNLFAQENI